MANDLFSHIDLRVADAAAALAFYRALMPALGFKRHMSGNEWDVFTEGARPPAGVFFGMTEDPDHRPNANRIAFAVGSRDEVDRIGALLRDLGATISSGPRDCPEYSPGYYAVFFEDPSGNLLEAVHRTG